MSEIIVKTQKELDEIPLNYNGYIYIEGGTYSDPLILKVRFKQAYIYVRGQAVISMSDSSTVESMSGSSTVKSMYDSSTVKSMYGSSTVESMSGSSTVESMYDSSTVESMYCEAMVSACGTNKITCHGNNIIRIKERNKDKVSLVMNNESHLIIIPEFKPTFEDYRKRYPIEVKDGIAKMYKAVKSDDGYFAKNDYEYKIGEKHEHECDQQKDDSCSFGLHVSHKQWAINFGSSYGDKLALLECEVPIDKIVVCKDCDGKVRTSELVVIREVPKEEYYL
jgi:hypothetical protein